MKTLKDNNYKMVNNGYRNELYFKDRKMEVITDTDVRAQRYFNAKYSINLK